MISGYIITVLTMLKFLKEYFICVCCFVVFYKTCANSYRRNIFDVNYFFCIPKKPFSNTLFIKKRNNFYSLTKGTNKKYFSKKDIGYEKSEVEEEKIKTPIWKNLNKGHEHVEKSDEENENKCNVEDRKKRDVYIEEKGNWNIVALNSDISPIINKTKNEKNESKKKQLDETIRKKMSELTKRRWQNEEERRKLLQNKKKFKHTEETKKLLSYKIKLKWKDEDYRKRIVEKTRSFNQNENTKKRKSIILKEKWKIKEFRDKMLSNRKPFSVERRQKISEIIKEKWKSEDYKQKTLKAIQENYKKRKLQVGLNPDLNYVQNVMLFKQLGLRPPKMRIFPDIHIRKLRNRKRKKRGNAKLDVASYKENWKHIYDSILQKHEKDDDFTYLNNVDNLSISRGL